MILNRQQKENLVIDLLYQGISFLQIAKQVLVSFSDINRIRQKVTREGRRGEGVRKGKKGKSMPSQAFE